MSESDFESELYRACGAMSVALNADQCDLMARHLALVVEANQQFNLTRITDSADAAVKHYADSLVLLATGWVDRQASVTVVDVGTGAGFPAVPLAISCPSWRVVAIDGTGKKARFVAQAADALGLTNLEVRHIRGEELARVERAKYDHVLLRAVGRLKPALEHAHDLIAPGGSLVFYKTPNIDGEEWSLGLEAADRLGLAVPEIYDIALSLGGEAIERRLIRFQRRQRKS